MMAASAAITASWAFAKVKSIRIEAAAERKRHAVPQVTTAEVIATLKKEKEVVEGGERNQDSSDQSARMIKKSKFMMLVVVQG